MTGVTAAAAAATMTLTGTTPPVGTDYMIFASPQRSAGVTYENDFRFIQDSVHADTYPLSIKTNYVAKFGALIAGKKVFVRVVQNQLGMQDPGTIFSVIVAA